MECLKTVFTALLVGLFGTISHQTQMEGLPVGILAGFAAVVIGAVESRLGGYTRLLFLFAFVALLYFFAQDWSGDKLIPANTLGLLWSHGAVLVTTVVCLWPKMKESQS